LNRPEVFVSGDVRSVRALHAGALDDLSRTTEMLEMLDRLAASLQDGHRAAHPGASVVIKNWFPPLVGAADHDINTSAFSRQDAQLAVAREHGFSDWHEIEVQVQRPDRTVFEQGVEATISGDLPALRRLVHTHPHLPTATSPYGHRATLLHYLAANGVETYRQQIPLNAVDVVSFLFEAGADPDATMSVYGGDYTALALVSTSGHTRDAGVVDGLVKALTFETSS